MNVQFIRKMYRLFLAVYASVLFMWISMAQNVLDFDVTPVSSSLEAVKTGVGEYALYRKYIYNNYYDSSYTVTCKTILGGPFDALLTITPPSTYSIRLVDLHYTRRTERYYLRGNEYPPKQKYTCRLDASMRTIQGSNQQTVSYIVQSEITVRFWSESYIYASSVGGTAYIGEGVNIFCSGYVHFTKYGQCVIKQQNTREKRLQTTATSVNSVRTCRWYGRCSSGAATNNILDHPIITIKPFLNLTLQPTTFVVNSSIHFTCQSDPPRLMRWTVMGHDDVPFVIAGQSPNFKDNTTITIGQKPGETTMAISESSPGENGITRVTCSTYGTDAFTVATAHLIPLEKYENATDSRDHWFSPEKDTPTVPSVTSGSPTVQTTVSPEPSMELDETTQQTQSFPRHTEPSTRCDCERCPKPTKILNNSNTGLDVIISNPYDSDYIDLSRNNSFFADRSYIEGMPKLISPILMTTTCFLFLVVICLLGVIWNLLSRHGRCEDTTESQPARTTTPASLVKPDDERYDNDNSNCIPEGTVMHYNPVYIQSSTDEASDDSEFEEESSVYQNDGEDCSVYQNDGLYTYANV